MYIKQVIRNKSNWGLYLLGIFVIIPIMMIIFQIPFTVALTSAAIDDPELLEKLAQNDVNAMMSVLEPNLNLFLMLLGFAGMLIIVRPGIIEFNIGTIMILTSLTFWSFIIILSKFVSKDDSPITMVSYQYTLMTFFSLPLAIYFWVTPSLTSLIYVFIGAISGTILHLSLALSYKYADLSVTQPIWFTGLIFGSGIGYFAFNETPDLWTWLGGIVVFSSVLVITYNEKNKDKKNEKNILTSVD